MNETPTAFALLTPPGAAAVATIAVAGPEAWDIVRQCFRPVGSRALPTDPEPDRFWYGQFGGPPGDAVIISGRQVDARVVVEIHCHGGPEVVRMISDELVKHGARSETPANIRRLAGVPGLRSSAEEQLSQATTLKTAAILLDQYRGAFANALDAVDAALATDPALARQLIEVLARRSAIGRHLTHPWRVVVAGAPNVGKSSLVNAIVGYQRSVVTPIPGTTRDAVATAVAIDGWPVELIDTAGQRTAGDDLEGQGIARGQAVAASADLCLWVVDATVNPEWPTADLNPIIIVVNKCDLTPRWDIAAIADAVIVSARTGAGLHELCEQISRRLVPEPPAPGEAIPFTADLADKIALIEAALAKDDVKMARATLTEACSGRTLDSPFTEPSLAPCPLENGCLEADADRSEKSAPN